MSLIIDRPHGISDSEQASPDDDLATAEDRVARARELSDRLFKEAKWMPQYKIVQANKDRRMGRHQVAAHRQSAARAPERGPGPARRRPLAHRLECLR